MKLKPAAPVRELKAEELRWQCDPSLLKFETTAEIPPLEGIIGQERALRALELGVELYAPGYNVFVCGLSGTGRMTTVKTLLERIRPACPPAPDRCYVHNFAHPEQPHLLTLPRGKGNPFAKDLDRAIDFLSTRIPQRFEDESFAKARQRILERYTEQEKEILQGFREQLKKQDFMLADLGPAGPAVLPVVEGEAVPIEQLEKLVEAGQLAPERAQEIEGKQEELQRHFAELYRRTLQIQRAMNLEMELLERETASTLVDTVIEELKEKYPHPGVGEHLEDVRSSILENLTLFKAKAPPPEEAMVPKTGGAVVTDSYRIYRVNPLLVHDKDEECPILIETTPSYANVFGSIQRNYDLRGVVHSDHMDIRGGSLLEADGGYLVLNAIDVLLEPGVWPSLKRTLTFRQLEIQTFDWLTRLAGGTLKPEPIEVNVKLLLVGERHLYDLLYAFEEDFKKIFKVKADFDTEMNRTKEGVWQYAGLLRKLCEEDKLCAFDQSAVAAVVEYGVRRAGRQDKLSTRFSEIADLARESHYWAQKAGSKICRRDHVEQAIKAHMERNNLVEEKIQEMIEKNVLLIDVTGQRTGQVNGLSVFDVGSYAFGRPVRITASVAMGRGGIINIEREANLSGRLHDKGVQILTGYLRQKFAQDKPLSLAASVCFEQSYSGVDGDSASSTEIYALLSALSGLPLRQDVAVTGSVNQKGDIQAIGGLNYKIEGFYEVCKAKGLTGTQGVILPKETVPDLMLRQEVVEAVKADKFHLWPIETIDQGIEILTGVKAGERGHDGQFEADTVNALVDRRLRELAEGLKQYEVRS